MHEKKEYGAGFLPFTASGNAGNGYAPAVRERVGGSEFAADAQPSESISDATTVPARSAKDDWRVALHESGHVIVGRVLGKDFGGVTIVPTPTFGGLAWGPTYQRSELSDNDERHVPDLCSQIGPLMPGPGDPRNDIVDMIAHVHHRIIELMAGTAAEALLHADDPPWDALSDLRQARALASLVCTSDQSIEALISFGYEEALSIIGKHRGLVTAMAKALVAHQERTLNAAEIDAVIAQVLANEAHEAEQARRAAWRRTVENAGNFRPFD